MNWHDFKEKKPTVDGLYVTCIVDDEHDRYIYGIHLWNNGQFVSRDEMDLTREVDFYTRLNNDEIHRLERLRKENK